MTGCEAITGRHTIRLDGFARTMGLSPRTETPMPLKARQLESLIVERSRKSASEVDQMMRRLREAGRLTAGPRGPHAPPLTVEMAAHILVTICGAVSPGDTVAAWSTYTRPASADGRLFLTVLADTLDLGAHDVGHVLLWMDSFSAEIVWRDGRREVFKRANDDAPEQTFDRHAREIAFIGGGFLREIAEALQ